MPVLSFGIGLAWAVRPLNFLENVSEAFAFCRMDGFYEAQSAGKVSLESWVPLRVLAFWAALNAVVENGFEAVEVGADDVDALIGDQSSQVLTHALTHDAGFAMVNGKALFEKNGRGLGCEVLDLRGESCITGKGEVVGVASVVRVGRFSEAL